MNWFAITSLGAYPTPTPTAAQRAAFAISYGLLSSVSSVVVTFYSLGGSLGIHSVISPIDNVSLISGDIITIKK